MITKALVKSPVKQLLNCFLFMPGLLKRGRARKGKAQTLINAEVWASLRPVCMGVSVNTHTHTHQSGERLYSKKENSLQRSTRKRN